MVGWPIAAGKLAGWLTAYHTKYQPNPPPGQRHLVAKCVTTLVTLTCGQMYLTGRDTSWPSLVLLQAGWPLVRWTSRQRHLVTMGATTLVRLISGHMYPHPKIRLWVRLTFGQTSGHDDLWSDIPPKTSGGQVWYHIRSLQWKSSFSLYVLRQLNWSHICTHIILCKNLKLKKSSGHGKMIDPLDDFCTMKVLLSRRVII